MDYIQTREEELMQQINDAVEGFISNIINTVSVESEGDMEYVVSGILERFNNMNWEDVKAEMAQADVANSDMPEESVDIPRMQELAGLAPQAPKSTAAPYYFLQGGIDRSKRYNSEKAAANDAGDFSHLVRIARVTLRKAVPGIRGSQVIKTYHMGREV